MIYNYNKLTPFKKYIIQNFPFIDADFDALTNYQLYCKIVEYLNKVIDSENGQNEQIELLTNAFNNLHDYVANYLTETNLQPLIDNKLDEMVEDGTLERIISIYINNNMLRVFNTVDDLKSSGLSSGFKAKTLGYYEINDGGGAEYIIKDEEPSLYYEELENGKFAELIIENNEINLKQLGARSQSTSNTKYDIKTYIDEYFNILSKTDKIIKLYIPAGVWTTSPITITHEGGFHIYGDENFDTTKSTIITAINNQSHILKIGDGTNRVSHWVLKNIIFSSANIQYSEENERFVFDSYYTLSNQAVSLLYATFGITDNLIFDHIKGQALYISSSWENYFKLLNFRNIDNLSGSILEFGTKDTSLVAAANISACTFDNIMFESVHGDLIYANDNCSFVNNQIGTINFEDGNYNPNNESYTTFSSSTIPLFDESTAIHLSVLAIKGQMCCTINNIILNNFSSRFFTSGSNVYSYDTIISGKQNGFNFNTIINNIHVIGMTKDGRILKQNSFYPYKNAMPVVNNVSRIYSTDKKLYYDVAGFNYINSCDIPYISPNTHHFVPTYFNADVIPFYKIAKLNSVSNYGALYYDPDTNNNLNLAVKPFSSNSTDVYYTIANTIVTGSNIKIRAKVDEGVTAILCLAAQNVDYKYQMSIVGTGSYQIYDFTNINATYLPFGTIVGIRLFNKDQIGKNCYLDYLKFY